MKIKEAIEELKNQELNIDSKAGIKALKMAIKSLEKQLELSLVELYPYNLALAIFGTVLRHTSFYDGKTSEEMAFELSVEGIEKGLKTLTDRERLVLEKRFKDRMTFEQLGNELDITRERVRQIEAKALRKLRHPSRLAKMKAYSYEDIIKNNEKITELEEENKLLNKATRMYISKEITREKLEKLAVSASIYDVRLEGLDLSVRGYNCLKRWGINNLGELSEMTYEELSLVRNLGRKSLEEILDKLKEFKIELKKGEQKRKLI